MSKRELVIRLQLPTWGLRVWAGAVAAFLVLGGAIALGSVMWTPFVQGEKLSSAKMNTNLAAMATAINALQVDYCGFAMVAKAGALGSYGGANKACLATCQNVPSAHVCRADEVGRILSTGGKIDEGIFQSNLFISYNGAGVDDCMGWTDTSRYCNGLKFAAPYPYQCSVPANLLCCR